MEELWHKIILFRIHRLETLTLIFNFKSKSLKVHAVKHANKPNRFISQILISCSLF